MTLSVQQCSRQDAEQITGRFRDAIGRVEASWHVLVATAIEAFQHRVWIPLGYASWDAYCAAEVDTAAVRIPRDLRIEIVGQMSEAGMSNRAIGPALGVDEGTIRNDRRSGAEHSAPNSETPSPTIPQGEPVSRAVGDGHADLFEDTPLSQEECEALDDVEFCDGSCGDGLCECIAGECSCGFLPTPDARVTGTDGKSYPVPPKPSEPKRKSLPDSFWRATFDLGKEVTRIENLADDDRFNRNADQIAQANLHDLIRARDALQRVIDKLNPIGV